MKTEISAGGLIVRKKGKSWQILLVKDRGDSWTFPKGKIEEGESRQKTAEREISEEVGLHALTCIKSFSPIHYWYRRNGLVSKTVYYFMFRYDGNEMPVGQIEEGIKNPTWMTFRRALPIVGYPETNYRLLERVHAITSIL